MLNMGSPFEIFNQLVDQAVDGHVLSGCRVVGRGGVGVKDLKVSHLLFADDTLIFCEASQDQLSHLCWVLMWFEAFFWFP